MNTAVTSDFAEFMTSVYSIKDFNPVGAIVDTNVLLNAWHSNQTNAFRSLSLLSKMGASLYVSEHTLDEADKRVRRLVLAGKSHQTVESFHSWRKTNGILILPVPPIGFVSGVNKNDEPIARTSLHNSIPMLTDDVQVIDEFREKGGLAFQPWAVLRIPRPPHKVDLASIHRVWGFSWRTFSAFVRFHIHHGDHLSRQATVFDLKSGLSVGFNGQGSPRWEARIAGQRLFLDASFAPSTCNVLGVTGAVLGETIRIKFMARDEAGYRAGSATFKCPDEPPSGPISIGHSRYKTSHLNGHISDLIMTPKSLAPRRFKHAAKWPDLSPAFEDENLLSANPVQRLLVG